MDQHSVATQILKDGRPRKVVVKIGTFLSLAWPGEWQIEGLYMDTTEETGAKHQRRSPRQFEPDNQTNDPWAIQRTPVWLAGVAHSGHFRKQGLVHPTKDT